MFVEELWLPDNNPPQVLPAVAHDIKTQIRQHGGDEITCYGLAQLETDQMPFRSYLDEFGHDLNQQADEGIWPYLALIRGAALAYLSYAASDFKVVFDDSFDVIRDYAEISGVPGTYAISAQEDTNLNSILDTALRDMDISSVLSSRLHAVYKIGAGCMRFFMKEALRLH